MRQKTTKQTFFITFKIFCLRNSALQRQKFAIVEKYFNRLLIALLIYHVEAGTQTPMQRHALP